MKRPDAPRHGARPVPFYAGVAAARDVRVTGDFSRWARSGVRLHHDGHGLWSALLSLSPGVYEYRLLIDGEWADHPEAPRRIRNPFGGQNCVMTVGESEPVNHSMEVRQ
jgi:1,4-alpha-glucan branching enzyme